MDNCVVCGTKLDSENECWKCHAHEDIERIEPSVPIHRLRELRAAFECWPQDRAEYYLIEVLREIDEMVAEYGN